MKMLLGRDRERDGGPVIIASLAAEWKSIHEHGEESSYVGI